MLESSPPEYSRQFLPRHPAPGPVFKPTEHYTQTDWQHLIEGRQAEVFVKGENIGFIGELSPEVITNFNLLVPVSSLELNLDKLFELIK